jgi:hypothetical protein
MRQEAYAATRRSAIANGLAGEDLSITDVDESALHAWRTTWSGLHPSGAGGWNWPALVERLPHRAAVLPVALWHGADLCGLVLATRRAIVGSAFATR